MISGCFDVLAGKVIRIGHMGENANAEDVAATLAALQGTLEKHGIKVACDLAKEFKTHMKTELHNRSLRSDKNNLVQYNEIRYRARP